VRALRHVSNPREENDVAPFRKSKTVETPESIELAASALVTVGALNWGLVGLFNFDLVATVLGRRSLLSKLVYTLVGASAVYLLTTSEE
jgi:uncharacterized membrane protein YuzA (DUF378 family)